MYNDGKCVMCSGRGGKDYFCKKSNQMKTKICKTCNGTGQELKNTSQSIKNDILKNLFKEW